GVIVTGLEPGSPAEQAGVQRGDRIERLDSERLLSTAQLRNLVATRGANADVSLVIVRGGERRTVQVRLGERPMVGMPPPSLPPGHPPQARGSDPRAPPFGVPGLPGYPSVPDPH